MIQFGGRKRGSVFKRLATIKQSGFVEEYIQDFKILVGQTKGVAEEQLMRYFIAGLQEWIRNQVRLLDSQELIIAMRMARDVEELHGGAMAGGRSMVKNQSEGEPKGVVTRMQSSRPNQNRARAAVESRMGFTVSMELGRREGTQGNNGSGATKGGNTVESENRGGTRGIYHTPSS